MISKLSFIVLLILLATGCRSQSLSSVETRESQFNSKPLAEAPGERDDAAGDRKSTQNKISHHDASSQRDSGEDAAIAAPSPTRLGKEAMQPTKTTDVETLVARAQNDFHEGRLDVAKSNYQRVLTADAAHPAAHQGLGNIADVEQNFPLALEHYQAALRRKPNDPDLLSDLGYSYLLQGKLSESEDALARALRLRSDHQRALNNLGLLCAARGDYDGALAAFRKTAGETGAHARMAQLFPQGRPGSGPRVPQPQLVMNAAEPQMMIQPRTHFGSSPQASPASASQTIGPPIDTRTIETQAAGSAAVVQIAAEIDIVNEPNGGLYGIGLPPNQGSISLAASNEAGPNRQFGTPAPREVDRRPVDSPYWPPRRNSESVEQQVRPAAAEIAAAQPLSADGLNSPRSPVSAAEAAEDLDPVAAYEAEIKRRSRPAYSVERSFHTGTGTKASVHETPNRDPYYPAR